MKQTLLTLTLCTATLITFATANTQTMEFDGNEAFTLTFVLDWKAGNEILSNLKDNTTAHNFTLFSLTDSDSTLGVKVQDDVVKGGLSFDPDTNLPVFGASTYTAYLQSVCTGAIEPETVLGGTTVFDTTSHDNGANSEIAALTVSYGNGTVGYYLRVSYDEYETVYETSTEVPCTANLSGLMELTYDDTLVKSVVHTEGAVDADGAAELNAQYAPEKKRPEPTPSVPEPATATLSLLALAGLAARRRRK